MASAIAISSCRRSPCERFSASVSARSDRPTVAIAGNAGASSAGSPPAPRKKRKLWPACAWTASATLASAENLGKIEVIWNERAMQSPARR